MLDKLREEVYRANLALPAHGLVTWTSGNVSARDPKTGLVVIKPSGVLFDELTPENMAIVDLAGNVVEAMLGPSTDTASHLSIYRRRPTSIAASTPTRTTPPPLQRSGAPSPSASPQLPTSSAPPSPARPTSALAMRKSARPSSSTLARQRLSYAPARHVHDRRHPTQGAESCRHGRGHRPHRLAALQIGQIEELPPKRSPPTTTVTRTATAPSRRARWLSGRSASSCRITDRVLNLVTTGRRGRTSPAEITVFPGTKH